MRSNLSTKMLCVMTACVLVICFAPGIALAADANLHFSQTNITQAQSAQKESQLSQMQTQSSQKKKAYKAYLKKIRQYQKRFGKTSIRSGAYGASYVSGVAFAKLVDFGFGVNYLVISYYDASKNERSSEPGGGLECYPVEVWGYQSGKMKRVYKGPAQLEGQNVYCSAIKMTKGFGRFFMLKNTGSYYPNNTWHTHLYGKTSSKTFGKAIKLSRKSKYKNNTYTYTCYRDGKKITQAKYSSLMKKWAGKTVVFCPNALQSTNRDINKTAKTVSSTVKMLKRVIG